MEDESSTDVLVLMRAGVVFDVPVSDWWNEIPIYWYIANPSTCIGSSQGYFRKYQFIIVNTYIFKNIKY
jgi:hypothetical protein